ncbi:MAG: gamma-glutamyltransferase [Gammaproteobacteria bacterium]|nr:gamma-glutamyltransferase [Gammaproteobacteria bacterium]MBT6480971.1 gamma-glutamyltransferase [Gammaproteobacteria bacterium]MBT7227729.1 gamma-glutamyltransferase [Gammaproteobacteria bacterium]
MNRIQTHKARFALLLALAACLPATNTFAASEDTPKTEAFAAIAIPDPYAAKVAKDILMQGGNAVDAAVATGFAMAVTYIDAGNIGGGGFMLAHMDGQSTFLDYREKAALAAHRDMYLDERGEVIENASLVGAQAAAVPGTVAGLWEAHQRHGSMPWRKLVQPAIVLARDGFMPAPILVEEIHANIEWFGDKTNFNEHFAAISALELFKQPELAATLERIAEHGPDDFYRGETARLIAEQMEKSNGLITLQDLENYEAVWREPLQAKWRDYQVLSSPPPSSGGFGVVQLLKMKDALAPHFEGVAHNSHQYIHLVAEMEKRVFADRAEYMGDPDYIDVDIDTLIADEYIARRAREVNPRVISNLEGVGPGLASPNTTHYSIIDQWGNAVSNTYTINWAFGSGVVIEGAGFLLNNEMDDFSAKPGSPNVYGVVGNYANEIQPGKRPLSSMSPTILLEDDKVMMVLGTPGGSTIFTSVFQTIVNIIDFGMTPLEAVSATRFHHQLLPPDLITMSISLPLPDETISALGERGYRVEPHDWEFGDVQVIWRDDDQLRPAADPRDRGVGEVFVAPTTQ